MDPSAVVLAGLEFRRAQPDEAGRAASLCPPAPARPGEGARHCFVAVRSHPVERLVAAAFWKTVPETDGTLSAEFQWSALPSLGRELPAFLHALAGEVAEREATATCLAAADWLPEGHPAGPLLESVGFALAGTRTVYHADAAAWRVALEGEGAELQGERMAPRGEHFDALRGLLCGPSLRVSELALGFHSAGSESPSLFDPRCSAVIVDGGAVVAACLANASRGHLTLAALAGPAALCKRLLHHCLQSRDKLPEPATLSFQLDDREQPGVLTGLLEKLPHTVLGRVGRYAQLLAVTSARLTEEKEPCHEIRAVAPPHGRA